MLKNDTTETKMSTMSAAPMLSLTTCTLLSERAPFKCKERHERLRHHQRSPWPPANCSPTGTPIVSILLVPGTHLQAGSQDCLQGRGQEPWGRSWSLFRKPNTESECVSVALAGGSPEHLKVKTKWVR